MLDCFRIHACNSTEMSDYCKAIFEVDSQPRMLNDLLRFVHLTALYRTFHSGAWCGTSFLSTWWQTVVWPASVLHVGHGSCESDGVAGQTVSGPQSQREASQGGLINSRAYLWTSKVRPSLSIYTPSGTNPRAWGGGTNVRSPLFWLDFHHNLSPFSQDHICSREVDCVFVPPQVFMVFSVINAEFTVKAWKQTNALWTQLHVWGTKTPAFLEHRHIHQARTFRQTCDSHWS